MMRDGKLLAESPPSLLINKYGLNVSGNYSSSRGRENLGLPNNKIPPRYQIDTIPI